MGINEKDEDQSVTGDLEIHMIELPKFVKKNPEMATKLEQWLWLLVGKESEVKVAEKENKEIKKVVEILERTSSDEQARELYDLRMKAICDQNDAIDYATNEGIKREKVETAKKMLEKGLDIDLISSITGLSEDEIKSL